MPIDLEQFKLAYEKWVEESMPDFQAGKMAKIVKKYPFVVSDDIPWTSYTGKPSEQTFARGSMFGEPGNINCQRRILLNALDALQTMTEPGEIPKLPYQWKRPDPA